MRHERDQALPNTISCPSSKADKRFVEPRIIDPPLWTKFVWITEGLRIHVRNLYRHVRWGAGRNDIFLAIALVLVHDGQLRRDPRQARDDAGMDTQDFLDYSTEVGKRFKLGERRNLL